MLQVARYALHALRRIRARLWMPRPGASDKALTLQQRDPKQVAAAAICAALFSVALSQHPRALSAGPKARTSFVHANDDHNRKPARATALAALRKGQQIDLNKATVEDLQLLPRIGPSLAKRIVEGRAARGSFSQVDDLLRIRGIGPKTLERLKPLTKISAGEANRTSSPADSARPRPPEPAQDALEKDQALPARARPSQR